MEEKFLSVKEVAEEWGLTVRRVQMLCTGGKLPGAKKIGNLWMIPEGTKRPQDNRMVSGEYKKAVFKAAVKNQSYLDSMNFLSVMSHGIRTSLNTIMGYSDMIAAYKDLPKDVAIFAQGIKNSGKTILNLIDNSVEYTRLKNNEVEIKEDICNLEGIVSELVEEQGEEGRRHNITIRKKYKLLHEFVKTDVSKITCIYSNLIENAVKYSKQDGMVSVRLEELPGEDSGSCSIKFTVMDNGIGMSARYVNQVLEGYAYEREVEEDAILNRGSGLGLAIVRELVKLMNGSISIESQLDFGTKVEIILDMKIANMSELSDKINEEVDINQFKGKRLLLAEDNELNREIEINLLTEAGFEVDWAGDGIICVADLERAKDGYYDMILMDIQMPNMNGVTATQVIRGLENKEKANIPVIAMTASVLKEDRERALKAGMSGFVEKPLNLKALLKVMKSLDI